MIILNEIDDKQTYYKIIEIIESNKEKKILFCYREAQREEGSLIRPPVLNHKEFYVFPMSSKKSRIQINDIIKEAIIEKYDMIIFYRSNLNMEDAKKIEGLENGIEIILSSVK